MAMKMLEFSLMFQSLTAFLSYRTGSFHFVNNNFQTFVIDVIIPTTANLFLSTPLFVIIFCSALVGGQYGYMMF